MGMFSRRRIQQMINENAIFLSKKQLDKHVSILNRNEFQSIDVIWEITILNAFSKIGSVTHEPSFEGSNREPDLLFKHSDGSEFLADIVSVSDEGLEAKTAVKAFYIELRKFIKKFGLSLNGWSLFVGSHPTTKYLEKRKPKLPPRSEFSKEIFNNDFKNFLEFVKLNPDNRQTYHVETETSLVTLAYNPEQIGFHSQTPTNNPAYKKNQNPVFNALKGKAKQLKDTGYKGHKGIIICDGGCDMMRKPQLGDSGIDFNAIDAARDFLRQNQSIDFVLVITVAQIEGSFYTLPGERTREVFVSIVVNKNFHSFPQSLQKSLENLEKHFPYPINTAGGFREGLRAGYDPKRLRPFSGGVGFMHNEIKISASSVLALLAGKITQEDLFKSLGFIPTDNKPQRIRNLFEYMLDAKMCIAEVKVEEQNDHDDNYLVFKFAGPDPAISPFVNPKSKED